MRNPNHTFCDNVVDPGFAFLDRNFERDPIGSSIIVDLSQPRFTSDWTRDRAPIKSCHPITSVAEEVHQNAENPLSLRPD